MRRHILTFPELKGKVWVHHAVEQRVLTKYPGIVTEAEIHSLANLRGIPNATNPEVHLSRIREMWNSFYKQHPPSSPPTKQQLLDYAKTIDDTLGNLFEPAIR